MNMDLMRHKTKLATLLLTLEMLATATSLSFFIILNNTTGGNHSRPQTKQMRHVGQQRRRRLLRESNKTLPNDGQEDYRSAHSSSRVPTFAICWEGHNSVEERVRQRRQWL